MSSESTLPPTIVWFRQDLRIGDNPAFESALRSGNPITALYIWDPESEGDWPPGGATKWWLHHSLMVLSRSLQDIGVTLQIFSGDTCEVLCSVAVRTRAAKIVWNRRYEPAARSLEQKLGAKLEQLGLETESHLGGLLFEPGQVLNQQGLPYKVFTPFYRACMAAGLGAEGRRAPKQPCPSTSVSGGIRLEQLNLLPSIPWDKGMAAAWTPGEEGAERELQSFLKGPVGDYDTNRDLPGIRGTSRLSPHLHFGEISPRRIWFAIERLLSRDPAARKRVEGYRRQLIWREFAHQLLVFFPDTPDEPLRPEFSKFPWKKSERLLRAWQKGRTGYPIVDAGMRELWTTGWMHNRVRMVVASFLVKHLLIRWQEGAKWFWDTLVDADLANNTLGWQWTAGCGADAAPYFRVFNPTAQGEKFDADGSYVKKWCPELAKLPAKFVHAPWTASGIVLADAGVKLDKTYPGPIVNHQDAREAALDAYDELTNRKTLPSPKKKNLSLFDKQS
ncbi:MAG: deoxyribodipyrimidine photo-lyase [Bdellovibrionota bacterium]